MRTAMSPLRQPPPGRHRNLEHKQRRTSNNSLTNIDSLPDELLFRILLELHAHEIYESALGVCRKWHQMIRTHDFIHAHLRHSTPGLLIQYFHENSHTFLTLRRGKIETFKSRYKQKFALPLFTDDQGELPGHIGVVVYAPASMTCKVVRSHTIGPNKNKNKERCLIYTVGVDNSWRYVDTQHLSHTALKLLERAPLTTLGFAYWIHDTTSTTSLLSLDLESEIITEIHIPQVIMEIHIPRVITGIHIPPRKFSPHKYYYLSTWNSLTLVVDDSRSGFSWAVWELKKSKTGGEWEKVLEIDLRAQKGRVLQLPYQDGPLLYPDLFYLKPVGWLNYPQVLVLCPSSSTKVCLLHDLVAQETHFLDLDHYSHLATFLSYKTSMVWFNPE